MVLRASPDGLVGHFDGMRALILAVPSNHFDQDLADEAAVGEYCAMTFDLTLPMTEIARVKGPKAHPFRTRLRAETRFQPGWNFNKVRIARDGSIAATFGAPVPPEGAAIAGRIEAMPE